MLPSSSSKEDVAGNATERTSFTSISHFCTSCHISFTSGQEQRTHSKEQWHINNVKRKAQSLPPISLEVFEEQIAQKPEPRRERRRRHRSRSNSSDESDSKPDSDDEGEQSEWPFQCLFCKQGFGGDETGFDANIEHMSAAHGLFIPNPDEVSDMQTFIGYLATEVRIWHECLYCGATKPSTSSVQNHMRAKGHCMLNLNREPELLDFWETSQEDPLEKVERPTNLSETEMRFASGKVIGSRHAASTTKPRTTNQGDSASMRKTLPSSSEPDTPLPPESEPARAPGRQLARREEMGMTGFSLQQRQVLAVAEKKAQRCEDVARRAREWVHAKGANAQKYDQIDTTGKWGKQSHKLLPR